MRPNFSVPMPMPIVALHVPRSIWAVSLLATCVDHGNGGIGPLCAVMRQGMLVVEVLLS